VAAAVDDQTTSTPLLQPNDAGEVPPTKSIAARKALAPEVVLPRPLAAEVRRHENEVRIVQVLVRRSLNRVSSNGTIRLNPIEFAY